MSYDVAPAALAAVMALSPSSRSDDALQVSDAKGVKSAHDEPEYFVGRRGIEASSDVRVDAVI